MSLNLANASFRQSRFLMVTIFGALLLAGCGCVEDKKSSTGWDGGAKKDSPAAKDRAKKIDWAEKPPCETPAAPVPATAVAMAGVTRMSRLKFILLDGAGALIFVSASVALGLIFQNAIISLFSALAE